MYVLLVYLLFALSTQGGLKRVTPRGNVVFMAVITAAVRDMTRVNVEGQKKVVDMNDK